MKMIDSIITWEYFYLVTGIGLTALGFLALIFFIESRSITEELEALTEPSWVQFEGINCDVVLTSNDILIVNGKYNIRLTTKE